MHYVYIIVMLVLYYYVLVKGYPEGALHKVTFLMKSDYLPRGACITVTWRTFEKSIYSFGLASSVS